MTTIENLENEVKKNLLASGLNFEENTRIGVAVSGGADSICLLTALHNVLPENHVLMAVTVNHNLRKEEETSGDADFVQAYCASIGVECCRFDIPRGRIDSLANERQCGVEEAARFVRYECFEKFARENNLSYICVAHNRNDCTETVLMRVLNGSSVLSGIRLQRDVFLRPLMSVLRSDIEGYLLDKGISWRTDSTNEDTRYLRNKIRHNLVPVLNENFEGWQKSILSLSEKSSWDEDFFEEYSEQCFEQCLCSNCGSKGEGDKERVVLNLNVFKGFHNAIKVRVVYKALSELGVTVRMPYVFVRRLIVIDEGQKANCMGVFASCEGGRIVFEKKDCVATEEAFFGIIEGTEPVKICEWVFTCSEGAVDGVEGLSVSCSGSSGTREIFVPSLKFPFAVRSKMPGDEIKTSDGSMKSISKAMSGLKINSGANVPLIQELQTVQRNVVCIWGSAAGGNDWLVKDWL